jgi:hypothetical protein
MTNKKNKKSREIKDYPRHIWIGYDPEDKTFSWSFFHNKNPENGEQIPYTVDKFKFVGELFLAVLKNMSEKTKNGEVLTNSAHEAEERRKEFKVIK